MNSSLGATPPMTVLQRQRLWLPHQAVLLTLLDADGRPTGRVASGFLRREDGQLHLYTCWHTVTGLDRNTRVLPPPEMWTRLRPWRVRVTLQAVETRAPGVAAVGGAREIELALYKEGKYLWFQDRQYSPHADLENVGLRFPFWHDAVKIPFPEVERTREQSLTDTDEKHQSMTIFPGDKVVFIGYPHGYSALETPTAVVITAHVAASFTKEKAMEFLLDRAGAPGMSGGPVFVEQDERLWAFGMYTGAVYPDQLPTGVPRVSTLGSCSNLTLL
jgi:hypothetical protein